VHEHGISFPETRFMPCLKGAEMMGAFFDENLPGKMRLATKLSLSREGKGWVGGIIWCWDGLCDGA